MAEVVWIVMHEVELEGGRFIGAYPTNHKAREAARQHAKKMCPSFSDMSEESHDGDGGAFTFLDSSVEYFRHELPDE